MSGYPIDKRIKHPTLDKFRADKIPFDPAYFVINNDGLFSMQTQATGDYLFSSATSKTGFFICDGSQVSRTTYAALFALIGTSFGIGNGSTTFNLPDFRGRVFGAIGQGTDLTNRVLGNIIGEENHTLTIAEIPNHDHAFLVNNYSPGGGAVTNQGYSNASYKNTNSTGGGLSHNNMQPTLFAGNVFIKY